MKFDSFGLRIITTSEAEAQSGIPAPSIVYWCKKGYLKAKLVRQGNRKCYEFYALDFELFLYSAHAGKHCKQPERVSISDVVISPATQLRAEINQDTINDYAADLEGGDEFPPILAVRLNGRPQVVDGGHRHYAKVQLKETMVDVQILENLGEPEAFHLAINANRVHGLQRSPEDKRSIAKAMLQNPTYACLSTRKLKSISGISHNLFALVRREIELGTTNTSKSKRDDTITPKRVAAKIRAQLTYLAITHPAVAAKIAETLKELEVENQP